MVVTRPVVENPPSWPQPSRFHRNLRLYPRGCHSKFKQSNSKNIYCVSGCFIGGKSGFPFWPESGVRKRQGTVATCARMPLFRCAYRSWKAFHQHPHHSMSHMAAQPRCLSPAGWKTTSCPSARGLPVPAHACRRGWRGSCGFTKRHRNKTVGSRRATVNVQAISFPIGSSSSGLSS